jgi:hypothetical protein
MTKPMNFWPFGRMAIEIPIPMILLSRKVYPSGGKHPNPLEDITLFLFNFYLQIYFFKYSNYYYQSNFLEAKKLSKN